MINALPTDTPVPLTDPRIPAWVLDMARKHPRTCCVVQLPPPAVGEWWLLDEGGNLIEATWLLKP